MFGKCSEITVRRKAYPGLTFAEDITVCHTGNQGAKIEVKVPKMHSVFSRGRGLTKGSLARSQAQAQAGGSFARERDRGFSLQPQFIKLLGEPAPWGRGGLRFQSVLFRQQIPESSPACPQADRDKV